MIKRIRFAIGVGVLGVLLLAAPAAGRLRPSFLCRRVRRRQAVQADRARHESRVAEPAHLLLHRRDGHGHRQGDELGDGDGKPQRADALGMDTKHDEGWRRRRRGRQPRPQPAAPWGTPGSVILTSTGQRLFAASSAPELIVATFLRRFSRQLTTDRSRARRYVIAAGAARAGLVALQVRRAAPQVPTPRLADGTPNLGRVPGEKGVWNVPYIQNMADRVVGARRAAPVRGAGGGGGGGGGRGGSRSEPHIPFMPWAAAVYDYNSANVSKYDPEGLLPPARRAADDGDAVSRWRSCNCPSSGASSWSSRAPPTSGARFTWTAARIRRAMR